MFNIFIACKVNDYFSKKDKHFRGKRIKFSLTEMFIVIGCNEGLKINPQKQCNFIDLHKNHSLFIYHCWAISYKSFDGFVCSKTQVLVKFCCSTVAFLGTLPEQAVVITEIGCIFHLRLMLEY